MMNICIDIGNTHTKVGVFNQSDLVESIAVEHLLDETITQFLLKHNITHSIISRVGANNQSLQNILAQKTKALVLTAATPVPFENLYATPQTLGVDRIALAAAATNYITENNVLVVSCGTCVTFEFVNRKAQYLGGAISPGLNMRLQAMSHFTEKLPLLHFTEPGHFNGNSTETCMQSGAYIGMLEEIKGRISLYETEFGTTELLLSGGDCFLFEKHLKKSVFAHPYLTLFGLNKILTYNV